MHRYSLREYWPADISNFNKWYLTGFNPNRPRDYEHEHDCPDPAFANVRPFPVNWEQAVTLLLSDDAHKHVAPGPFYFRPDTRLRISFRDLAAFHFIYRNIIDCPLILPELVWPRDFRQAVLLSRRRFLFIRNSEHRLKSSSQPGRALNLPLCEFSELNQELNAFSPYESDLKLFPPHLMMPAAD